MATLAPSLIRSWSPLRYSVFRALWIASIASNLGTWMQNVGATWLMTSLNPSPTMVSMIQAANFLPVCLLALPAGALADRVDRRRLLLFTQMWMLMAAACLGFLAFSGSLSSWLLLTLTFILGAGAALNGPAWQAIILEIIPTEELAEGIALGSASFNFARAVGPALGGFVVAAVGPGANFYLNAISFLGVIFVLYRWKREPIPSRQPPEKWGEAMMTGIRFVRESPDLYGLLLSSFIFAIPSSALWALLPIITHDQLKMGASTYGALLGCLGIGALLGTVLLPSLREFSHSLDHLVGMMTGLFAIATFATAWVHSLFFLGLALILGGIGWLVLLSTLSTLIQLLIPEWVRARSLSIYILIFFVGMTVGSLLWGVIATLTHPSLALNLAGICLIASLAFQRGLETQSIIHTEVLQSSPNSQPS